MASIKLSSHVTGETTDCTEAEVLAVVDELKAMRGDGAEEMLPSEFRQWLNLEEVKAVIKDVELRTAAAQEPATTACMDITATAGG